MADPIKGFRSKKINKKAIPGYTQNQTEDSALYATLQEVSSDRVGADVVIHGLYKSSLDIIIGANSNLRVIELTAHGANAGDVLKINSTNEECPILSVVDANKFILANELKFDPVGMTGSIWKYTTPSYNSDGSLNVAVTPSPVSYSRKSAGVTNTTTVLEDLDTPTNSRALPVVIHSVDGAPIVINAGDLSVSTSHVNDSMSIGDGTTLVGVTASNELKVSDATAIARLTDVLSTNNATTTPLGAGATYTGTGDDMLQYECAMISIILDRNGTLYIESSQDNLTWEHSQPYAITVTTPGVAEGQFFQAMKEARYLRVRFINGATPQGTFKVQMILNQVAGVGEVQAVAQALLANTDALVTKGVIYGQTTGGGGGYVAVKVNPSGALTVDATVAQLPATLGQKVMAQSMSVAIASDQSDVPTLSKNGYLASATNSTTTPLAGGATFTGTAIDTFGYSSISVLVASDVASATNGMQIQYSGDGVNWDEATVDTYTPGSAPNVGQCYGGGIRARYARIVYTNGASAQAAFRLSTILRSDSASGDRVDLESTLGLNSHAMLTKSLITGKTTAGGGAYVDVKVTPSGALAADVTGTVAVSSSALPTGASTLAEQQSQTTALGTLNTNVGAQADAVATTDTGTFSLIALIKKVAQNITAMSAKLPAALGSTTSANSLSITPASDAIFNTKPKALTNQFDENAAITTVVTFTAPANAIGGKIMATDTNTTNARYKQGGTATTTSGMQLQPGRAEDFTGGSNITVVAESGTVGVSIQWTIQA